MNYCQFRNETIKRMANAGGGAIDPNIILLLPLNGNFKDYSINSYAVDVTGNPDFATGYFANTQAVHVSDGNYIQYWIQALSGDFSFDCFAKCSRARDIRVGCYSINVSNLSDYGGVLILNSVTASPAGVTSKIKKAYSYNTWYHIALTRENNILRLFTDGALSGYTTTDKDAGTRFAVDSGENYGQDRNLYVSNARLTPDVLHVNNNGVYTFPVPTKLYVN